MWLNCNDNFQHFNFILSCTKYVYVWIQTLLNYKLENWAKYSFTYSVIRRRHFQFSVYITLLYIVWPGRMFWPVLCLGSYDWVSHVTVSVIWLDGHVTWNVMWLGRSYDWDGYVTGSVICLGRPYDWISYMTRKDLGSMLECFYTPLIIDKLPCILLYIAENCYKNSHVYLVWCWMPCTRC